MKKMKIILKTIQIIKIKNDLKLMNFYIIYFFIHILFIYFDIIFYYFSINIFI